MVNLLGDSRGVQETVAREVQQQTKGYKREDDGSFSIYDDKGNVVEQGLDFDDAKLKSGGVESMLQDKTVYDQSDTGRQAGFASAEDGGGFLGLSAFTEDLAAGNLSRQRERDLLDVARLSGTYQDIMEDYKPGTQEALADAKEVLASQKDNLTGAEHQTCLLYTSPSPRDGLLSRMPSSA